jgi:hypothetical protein
MKALFRFGMLCAFGVLSPVAFAAGADTEEVAASTIAGYNVSFSGGG